MIDFIKIEYKKFMQGFNFISLLWLIIGIVIALFFRFLEDNKIIYWYIFGGTYISGQINIIYVKLVKNKIIELDYLVSISRFKVLRIKVFSSLLTFIILFLLVIFTLYFKTASTHLFPIFLNMLFIFTLLWILALAFNNEFILYISSILIPYITFIKLNISTNIILALNIISVVILIMLMYYVANKKR